MQVSGSGKPGAQAVPLQGLRASAFVLLEFRRATAERHPGESKESLKRSLSLPASKKLSDG